MMSWSSLWIMLLRVQSVNDTLNFLVSVHFFVRFLDCLDDVIREHSSLQVLWYMRDKLSQIFTRALKSNGSRPSHCIAIVDVLTQGVYNIHETAPFEVFCFCYCYLC